MVMDCLLGPIGTETQMEDKIQVGTLIEWRETPMNSCEAQLRIEPKVQLASVLTLDGC